MKKFLITLMMALAPMTASAAGGAGVPLDSIDVDLTDKASLQRGMQTFVNRCMGCHEAGYQRFERAAQDLGIPNELVEEYLIFNPETKIGEHMKSAMAKQDAAGWFGAPPPDLTLEARLRGPDWIYTYLRSFYADENRPWGVNNAVFPDVGMPNVLEDLQGKVVNHCTPEELAHGQNEIDPLTGKTMGGCLTVNEAGSQSPEEFDKTIYDLVNFMTYMGEPSRLESERLGTKVLIFLAILFVFAFALKKEYWKDVH
ncbi:cytochrome c1 [Marinobacterium sediminicola]|uniref:Ubiquinol-cytochrome c reductase cytochrome c1 subunit n=1 Tax=Marinobacterium sediminicola TaxID=518898 RepID=A0ABY1S013_9GAMM|nr:cytochrome c1 [Marinobacterium sediminicola]ULG70053.1 cytochrome c1 [Marinobacterium sediminicola]SMR74508.1 ubiquinol-cytochrome c reductase cytochrome c1 subunit [Marinobacterium sediminicola]